MNANRLLKLTFVMAIFLVAFVAIQVFTPLGNPTNNVPVYTGRGDYQRFEAQGNIQPSLGIGDLRRFESQEIFTITGASESHNKVVGIGDLRLFEKNSRSNLGIGELRRFESMQ